MRLIFVKLFRDIRKGLGQFLSMLLVIAVGCFFFAGMNEASSNLKGLVDDYYAAQKLAPVTGGFLVADDEALALVKARAGVRAASGRYQFNSFFTHNGSGRIDAVVTTLTEGFNEPLVRQGRLPQNESECIIDETYASANSLKPGDTVRLFVRTAESVALKTTDGSMNTDKIDYESFAVQYTSPSSDAAEYRTLTVSGTFISPEFIYKVNSADTSALADEFACVLVPYEAVDMIAPEVKFYLNDVPAPFYVFSRADLETKLYNQILADTKEGLDVFDVFEDNALDIDSGVVGVYVKALSYTKEEGTAYKSFDAAYSQIKNLVIVLPMLFFLVAAVITFISLGKIVENQRSQIGVMQAIGIGKGGVYFGYLMYAALAALFGALLGGVLGAFALPYIYYLIFTATYVMPPFVMGFSPLWAAVGIVVSLAVAVLSALLSCHRTLKENPAQAMRPKTGKSVRSVFLEKWTGLWKRMSFGAKMITRNLLQNKLRVLLSSIGVIASMVLLVTGVNLKSRVDYTVDDYTQRLNYDVQIVTYDNVADEKEFISAYPQITEAVRAVGFAATVSKGDKKSDVLQVSVLPENSDFVNLYMDSHRRGKIEIQSDSLILPHFLAKELGVKAGDEVEVTAAGYSSARLKVTDVAYQYLLPSVYVGPEVLRAVGAQDVSTVLYARLKDGTTLAADANMKAALDKEALKERALKMSEILDMAVVIIILGAAVLAVTVIYNITSINLTERSREIATLMVLGYRKNETSRLILIENLVITVLGCLIGLPLGYGMFYWLSQVVSTMNVAIPINLPVPVALICVGAVFVFSMAATLLLLRKMLKIDMVEALKSVE